jgi:hypothetical protein
MNVCDDGVFHFLTNYFKSPKFIFCVCPIYLLVADKSSKTCIVQRRAESVKLFASAFGHQFDPAVGQIADGAGDFKPGGDRLGGVAKAHALHMTGEKRGHPAAKGVGGRLRHAQDEAKGADGMQLFSATVQIFLILV